MFYTQALDFVQAVREYGALLLAALEKSDAAALAVLLASNRQQLLQDADQIFQWRVDEAQRRIDALNRTLALAQSRFDDSNTQAWANDAEYTYIVLKAAAVLAIGIPAGIKLVAAIAHLFPQADVGVTGAGGTPKATVSEGGDNAGKSADSAGDAAKDLGDALDKASDLAKTIGEFMHRADDAKQKATESRIQIEQASAEIAAASLRQQIVTQEQTNHQAEADQLQQEIDFYQSRFTNTELYDWMVDQLADVYFQSYRLAYRICKAAERCYRYELGLPSSAFIQFGYWDSLRKGLLAGEALNHDLRRMQASYLEQNSRRFEISRYVSLRDVDPNAMLALLEKGVCDFDLPESLFDSDYPGHFQRHLLRVSLTLVYPNPGPFDNVKATLTLAKNSVRVSSDLGPGYARTGSNDSRFVDQYGAVPQKIALGSAQDDPGLFVTSISGNIGDVRYLPFEGAGAISSWRLELPAASNEVDLTTISDVVIHLYYTSLDGGDSFQQAVISDNAQNLPTSGVKLFSAQEDFGAAAPTDSLEYPLTAWQRFLGAPAPATDQTLVLNFSPAKFPSWTRGKTIAITGLTVLATSWNPGIFVLKPQAPLPVADVNMTPVPGVTEPSVASGLVALGGNVPPGPLSFKLRSAGAADFRSMTENDVGDLLLLIAFQAT
jgi:hypothetical protein